MPYAADSSKNAESDFVSVVTHRTGPAEMINQSRDPIEWVCLLTELDKARSRLEALERRMLADGSIEEAHYAALMRQVYAHLNRAWHTRALTQELSQEEWSALARKFPSDLEPLG